MRTRRFLMRSVTAAAMSAGLIVGTLVYATPAYAWQCREVTAQDMRVFATSTSDALTPPNRIFTGRKFRNYGTANNRFSISVHVGVWYAGWVSANSAWSRPSSGCP